MDKLDRRQERAPEERPPRRRLVASIVRNAWYHPAHMDSSVPDLDRIASISRRDPKRPSLVNILSIKEKHDHD